jgi:hypothetical protein
MKEELFMSKNKENIKVKNFEFNKKEIAILATCLAPFIKEFFTSEKGNEEFKKWRKARKK